jgi:hypothetical protein
MKKYCWIIITMLAGMLPAQAQQEEDLGLWTSVGVEKKISQRVTLKLEENLRFYDNVTKIDQFFTNLGAQYKISKHFKIAGFYRFIQKHRYKTGNVSIRHRFYADLTFRVKVKPLIFVDRFRVQTQVQDIYSSELGNIPESRTRNKAEFRLDLDKRYQPYISGEIFYQIQDPRNEDVNNYLNAVRYSAGVDYEISYRSVIGAYYILQTTLNDSPSLNEYIIGLEYTISF